VLETIPAPPRVPLPRGMPPSATPRGREGDGEICPPPGCVISPPGLPPPSSPSGSGGCAKEAPPPQPVVGKPAPKAQASRSRPSRKAKNRQKKGGNRLPVRPRGKRDPFVSFVREVTPQTRENDLAPFRRSRVRAGRAETWWHPVDEEGPEALVETQKGGILVTTGSRIGARGAS